MCGIAGYIGGAKDDALERMLEAVQHRGPDAQGTLERAAAHLAHARLSIIDTSSAATQPMETADGSVAIIFNGEIYNFKELRAELETEGATFATHSDTEVILQLYQKRGESTFKILEGMFAIAIYDFAKKKLLLARDRMGEKPLYWTLQNGTLLFASELKALLVSGAVTRKINLEAVNQYLLYDYVPTPNTMIEGVFKLEPATLLTFEDGKVTKSTFWHPPQHIENISKEDALLLLDEKLSKTIEQELISDVPLGVFLSGGIDSSTVAYYAQRQQMLSGGSPIETFSIGFDDAAFDESVYARAVAKRLGTIHHEQIVTADDALDLIPQLAEVLSEPVADASIIPTLLLSNFARESVTVALGGDGGDELFAGYPTFHAERLYKWYSLLPETLKKILSELVEALPSNHGNFSLSYNFKKFLTGNNPNPALRHLEWLGTFPGESRKAVAGKALRHTVEKADVFAHLKKYLEEVKNQDAGNQLLYIYARTFLMDQVMVKVDRASMHYALETRAPFLNRPVVDFIFSLPYHFKYYQGTTKHLLKQLMQNRLPTSAVSRKKKGFGIPLAKWLSYELRPLCEELLSPEALGVHNLFNRHEVARLMQQHFDGKRDNRKELWNLMVFQLWYRRWMQ